MNFHLALVIGFCSSVKNCNLRRGRNYGRAIRKGGGNWFQPFLQNERPCCVVEGE